LRYNESSNREGGYIKDGRWLFLVVCLLFMSWIISAQEKIEIKKIDGLAHILNPATPLKATVQLEVEKSLTINPYDQPDAGLRGFIFMRDEDGAVILYDPNNTEAHRFGPLLAQHLPADKKSQDLPSEDLGPERS